MSETSVRRTPEAAAADRDDQLALLRAMMLIRRFEEQVQRLFERGEVPGTTHLCIGQEAVCVGLSAAMRPDDVIATTYRGHGHVLARGSDPLAVAAELLGRASGLNRGRGGSMNLTDFSRGVIGSFGSIGGSMAAATGAGVSLAGTGRAAVATFGDGCANHGYFFECLNFAAVRALPVLYVCENNLYGEYTPWEQVTAGGDILARARVFGINAEQVDGMDVAAVRVATSAALERVRSGEGPQFVECRTYRYVGHSRTDPAVYRKDGELDAWLARDPIALVHDRLTALGVATSDLEHLDEAVTGDVLEIFRRAREAPFPQPEP